MDELGGDLLSSAGLVTSSEEYYPTVAINALMRTLRDPSMSSHHPQVVRSLFYIFQALQLAAVPYLPKVRRWLLPCTSSAWQCLDHVHSVLRYHGCASGGGMWGSMSGPFRRR